MHSSLLAFFYNNWREQIKKISRRFSHSTKKMFKPSRFIEGHSLDRIKMTEWKWLKSVNMTEKLTTTNVDMVKFVRYVGCAVCTTLNDVNKKILSGVEMLNVIEETYSSVWKSMKENQECTNGDYSYKWSCLIMCEVQYLLP